MSQKKNALQLLSNSAGFEKNLGQVTDFDKNPVDNLFSKNNLKNLSIFITAEGVSLVIYQTEKVKMNLRIFSTTPALALNLLRETLRKNIVNKDELPGYTNYYYPSCPDGILFVKS